MNLAKMAEAETTSPLSVDAVETNRQNFNTDWRAEKPNFDDQMSHFCMKQDMADLEFVFNRQNRITVRPNSRANMDNFFDGFRKYPLTSLHCLLLRRFSRKNSHIVQKMSAECAQTYWRFISYYVTLMKIKMTVKTLING